VVKQVSQHASSLHHSSSSHHLSSQSGQTSQQNSQVTTPVAAILPQLQKILQYGQKQQVGVFVINVPGPLRRVSVMYTSLYCSLFSEDFLNIMFCNTGQYFAPYSKS